MHHVVQANLFNEFGFQTLLHAFEDNGCAYTIVKVVPFAHTLEPELSFSPNEKVMVWGSLTLDGIAKERGWKPGCFQNKNFDMRLHAKRFGSKFLNHDAVFCTFEEMNFDTPMFCRPVHDTKTFTGTVIHPEELAKWKEKIIGLSDTGYSSLRPDTPVMYASVKPIQFEARFFIVDGVVVTGSVYRSFGEVLYSRIDSQNAFFYPMMKFAQDMTYARLESDDLTVGSKVIDKAYVLDVGMTGSGECFVIEVNTINSAGFYDSDMGAVIRALEAMVETQQEWKASIREQLDNNF
jgi:hypothetical protein